MRPGKIGRRRHRKASSYVLLAFLLCKFTNGNNGVAASFFDMEAILKEEILLEYTKMKNI